MTQMNTPVVEPMEPGQYLRVLYRHEPMYSSCLVQSEFTTLYFPVVNGLTMSAPIRCVICKVELMLVNEEVVTITDQV